VKTHIVKIGNSQGVRIPKALLEQTRLSGEVVLELFPAPRVQVGSDIQRI
jgi:antitoxin component of MazEF toxin-antitoxin module